MHTGASFLPFDLDLDRLVPGTIAPDPGRGARHLPPNLARIEIVRSVDAAAPALRRSILRRGVRS